MDYIINMQEGLIYKATFTADQFDNLKRVLNSGSTALFQLPGFSIFIVPSKVISVEVAK